MISSWKHFGQFVTNNGGFLALFFCVLRSVAVCIALEISLFFFRWVFVAGQQENIARAEDDFDMTLKGFSIFFLLFYSQQTFSSSTTVKAWAVLRKQRWFQRKTKKISSTFVLLMIRRSRSFYFQVMKAVYTTQLQFKSHKRSANVNRNRRRRRRALSSNNKKSFCFRVISFALRRCCCKRLECEERKTLAMSSYNKNKS